MTKLLLIPLVLHVFMILIIGMRMLSARIKAIKNGSAKLHEIALDNYAWPKKVKLLSNNFSNQFETPMLWYALCACIVALQIQDRFFVAFSWMFLLTRMAHSFVHVGTNNLRARLRIYLFGFATLIFMWLWFAVKLILIV